MVTRWADVGLLTDPTNTTPLLTVRVAAPDSVPPSIRSEFTVAALETLDRSGDVVADAVHIFLVNFLADGLTNLLDEDLLGGLGRDASHFFLRQRDEQHIADLDLVACEFLSFLEREFRRRIFDLEDNDLLSGNLDDAFVIVPLDLNALACLILSTELLSGRGLDRFLD